VDKGFAVIEKKFPDSLGAKSQHAHLAILAGDRAKACKYFDLTEGKIDTCEWDSMAEYVRFVTSAYYPERFPLK